MNDENLNKSLEQLISWIETEEFMGYDPYDVLNSGFPFHWFGKWGPPVATQIHKRNPVNIRGIMGIKKEYNPKAMGLFLKAYCNLYEITKEYRYLEKANSLFSWLVKNFSEGYSGYCWGYNFPWATPKEYKPSYLPSVVVTSTVIDGIYEYYKQTKSENAKKIIHSAANYVLNDIPITNFENGHSFAYTHQSKGVCYNASLHAAEILDRAKVTGKSIDKDLIEGAVMFVINRQKQDGSWYYSYNPDTDTERRQIDFHQGFILVSLYNILQNNNLSQRKKVSESISKGLEFYRDHQFTEEGQSFWRLPKKYPVDIHNQSQGILTFSIFNQWDRSNLKHAEIILNWTTRHMQDKTGYFYYRIHPFYTDKTPYIRWGQAWMLLAISEFIKNREQWGHL